MNEILSGNLTCKSYQTGTYDQVQYLFGATPNAGDCCTLRFTGFGVGAVIGVGGYFNAFDRQCRLTGDLRNSPVTITSPSGGFADPIVLTSDPADIKFSSASSGSDPWYVYWLGPYNQVPYVIRDNPGYVVNGATYSSDDGGALVFDGTDDYVQVPNSSALQLGTGDFTIEMWWYMIGSGNCRGFTLGDASDANGMELYVGNSGASLYVYIQNAIRITADSVPSFDTWHHYVIERTSGTMKLYIDGVVQSGTYSSSQSLGTGTDGDLRLGVEYYSSSLNFVGDCKISNFKIYKGKGLTAAEFEQNYNATKGRYGL